MADSEATDANPFHTDSFPEATPALYLDAFREVWMALPQAGRWLDGAERLQIVDMVRGATPLLLGESAPDIATLPDDMAVIGEVVRRVATDPGSLHRAWFDEVVSRIGLGRYAETVAVITQVIPIDRFCELIGRDLESLPAVVAGEPSMTVPDGLADDGAWLPMTTPFPGANVARSFSYVPEDNAARLRVVRAMYSGTRFNDLVWADGALSRPQVELVAARTSALHECFY